MASADVQGAWVGGCGCEADLGVFVFVESEALFVVVLPAGVVQLELELILSQMAQKPMLRGEVGARALRVRSDVRGHG